jgi:hypothetical protein
VIKFNSNGIFLACSLKQIIFIKLSESLSEKYKCPEDACFEKFETSPIILIIGKAFSRESFIKKLISETERVGIF